MSCEWHCQGGLLPTRGENDAILITRDMAIDAGDRELEGQVYMELLMPTSWRRCFCVDTDNLPRGVEIDE